MRRNELSLQILNPHAAGIDVGFRNHIVAVDQNAVLECYKIIDQALIKYAPSSILTEKEQQILKFNRKKQLRFTRI